MLAAVAGAGLALGGKPLPILAAAIGAGLALDIGRFVPTMRVMTKPRWGWPENAAAPDHADQVYGRYRDRDLLLDIYLPPGERTGPVPLVVFIHGGGWLMGDKALIEPGVFDLLGRGFAVASVGYSLSGEAQWPEQGLQVKGAVRWLRANAERFGFDPDAFFVFGGSAGGHLAAFLATTNGVARFDDPAYGNMHVSSAVQRAVLWYAPTDLLRRRSFSLLRLVFLDGEPRSSRSASARLIGGAPARLADAARDASPLHWISRDTTVPCLLMHGTHDVVVPCKSSIAFAERLEALGIPHKLIVETGYRHVDMRFNDHEHMQIVGDFLSRDPSSRDAVSA